MSSIAIIAGKFHQAAVQKMIVQAGQTAEVLGLRIVQTIWVPGSFEVPLALQQILETGEVDGVVLLGIIERGETKHGLVMAQAVYPEVIRLQLKYKKPVGIGVIGPEVLPEQIEPRLLPHAKSAVEAVGTMLGLLAK